jgi:serine O-acetyltransferase
LNSRRRLGERRASTTTTRAKEEGREPSYNLGNNAWETFNENGVKNGKKQQGGSLRSHQATSSSRRGAMNGNSTAALGSSSSSSSSTLPPVDNWNMAFDGHDEEKESVAAWDWGYIDEDHGSFNPVWTAIRQQAEEQSLEEPLLSSYLYGSVLSHQTFENALANVLANSIGDATLLTTQLFPTFLNILKKDEIREAALLDVQVTKDRDPACGSYLEALLNFKGYHALQLHRISHDLYTNGRDVIAQKLQSRSSEVYGVDIHPGAKFGKGILIDHATGVVVGETAVIGDNSSLLQGVTLGGTGKACGDRHPKLGKNVLIGAQATVLGNITIGDGSMVAAGSVVLKDVPAMALTAGIPARIVGSTSGRPSTLMDQISSISESSLRKRDAAGKDRSELEGGIEYFL